MDDEHQFPLRDGQLIDVRIDKKIARSRFIFDALNIANARIEALGFALPSLSGGRVAYYYPHIGFAARAGLAIDFNPMSAERTYTADAPRKQRMRMKTHGLVG